MLKSICLWTDNMLQQSHEVLLHLCMINTSAFMYSIVFLFNQTAVKLKGDKVIFIVVQHQVDVSWVMDYQIFNSFSQTSLIFFICLKLCFDSQCVHESASVLQPETLASLDQFFMYVDEVHCASAPAAQTHVVTSVWSHTQISMFILLFWRWRCIYIFTVIISPPPLTSCRAQDETL